MTKRLYSTPITRETPSAVLFLVDRSGSMGERVLFGRDNITKAEAVARIINSTITEIGMRCRRSNGVYNYLDIAAVGYSGDSLESLLPETLGSRGPFVPIAELDRTPTSNISYRILFSDPKIYPSTLSVKEYVTPYAEGKTPMNEAIVWAHKQIKEWIKHHTAKVCFPPIVIHITDGEATDAPIADIVKSAHKLCELSTEDGNVILLNINLSSHISSKGKEILFPADRSELDSSDSYVNMLFDISSPLPEIFHSRIAKMKKCRVEEVRGARAMGYNIKVTDFLKLMSIGSISINMIK